MVTNERQVNDLLYRYSRGIDTKDWELLESCFAPDIVATYGDITWHGREAFMDIMIRRHSHLAWSQHRTLNVLVELDSDTSGVVHAYWDAWLSETDDPQGELLHCLGTYEDKVARLDGRWVLTERVCMSHWVEGQGNVTIPLR